MQAKDEQKAIALVKARGMHVPIWATLMGWLGVMCATVAFILL
jgi:hypothetical protein